VIKISLFRFYVTDHYCSCIQKFDSAGNFLAAWRSYGFGDGEFLNPSGVAVDAAGNVYVADRGNGRIQKFAPRAPAPGAAFTANTTAGPAPLAVRFTDTLTGNPSSWLWDFGDKGTSTDQHTTHTYTTPGNYTVTLSVDGKVSTATKPDYIKVTPILFGDATGDGEVNQADTLLVLQQVVGLKNKPDADNDPLFQKTDVNQNGVIEVGDALFIAQYNVGLRDVWFELLE